MPARDPRQRLQDILDAIADIERFTAGKSFEQYQADALVRRATERLIEIISESSRHVPQTLKDKYPSVPWQAIADIGNVFRHAYDRVNDRRVWAVVSDDLKPLKKTVQTMAAEIEKTRGS
jgi:uncharacterized protein with HEPN domain